VLIAPPEGCGKICHPEGSDSHLLLLLKGLLSKGFAGQLPLETEKRRKSVGSKSGK
jgi:hypothetical protein